MSEGEKYLCDLVGSPCEGENKEKLLWFKELRFPPKKKLWFKEPCFCCNVVSTSLEPTPASSRAGGMQFSSGQKKVALVNLLLQYKVVGEHAYASKNWINHFLRPMNLIRCARLTKRFWVSNLYLTRSRPHLLRPRSRTIIALNGNLQPCTLIINTPVVGPR